MGMFSLFLQIWLAAYAYNWFVLQQLQLLTTGSRSPCPAWVKAELWIEGLKDLLCVQCCLFCFRLTHANVPMIQKEMIFGYGDILCWV